MAEHGADIRDGDLVLVSRGDTYVAWVQRAGARELLRPLGGPAVADAEGPHASLAPPTTAR
jgi:hypothetical protein